MKKFYVAFLKSMIKKSLPILKNNCNKKTETKSVEYYYET